MHVFIIFKIVTYDFTNNLHIEQTSDAAFIVDDGLKKELGVRWQSKAHEDAQEFFLYFLNRIDDILKKSKEYNFIEDLYKGTICNILIF